MKPKCIIFCDSTKNVHYVFTEQQLGELASKVDLRPGIIKSEELPGLDLSDVEVAFSTWGMPSLSEDAIARCLPSLKVLFYAAGATDDFARPMFARGVKVVSAWQANAIPVSQLTVSQVLLGLKGYFRNSFGIHSRKDWAAHRAYVGPGIYGERVALIGDGAIAHLVYDILTKLNLDVLMIPSHPDWRTVSLEDAFKTAYVVSNHLPNRTDNVGVLDGHLFRSMRHGAVFINTGRGAQVNEAELIETLRERPDLTALLDVMSPEPPEDGSPLYTLPNVHLSTHIAGSVNDEVHRMAAFMLEELDSYLAGRPFRYEVNESMLITSTK